MCRRFARGRQGVVVGWPEVGRTCAGGEQEVGRRYTEGEHQLHRRFAGDAKEEAVCGHEVGSRSAGV